MKRKRNILLRRPLTILGFVLMLVGFGAPAVAAVVHIDTTPPNVCGSFPLGTTSTPTSLNPSTSYTIYLLVETEKVSEAWVLIDGVRKNLPTETFVSQAPYFYGYEYSTSWTSPAAAATYIKFEFKAKDAAGNIGSKTAYATIGHPTGDFYINNQGPLNKESVITLNTRSLDFKCVPKDYASMLTRVYIKVTGDASVPWLDLTKQGDGNWTGSWTAPQDGTYTISGYVVAGDFGWQMCSLVAGINELDISDGESYLWWFPYMGFIGVGMFAIGLWRKK